MRPVMPRAWLLVSPLALVIALPSIASAQISIERRLERLRMMDRAVISEDLPRGQEVKLSMMESARPGKPSVGGLASLFQDASVGAPVWGMREFRTYERRMRPVFARDRALSMRRA